MSVRTNRTRGAALAFAAATSLLCGCDNLGDRQKSYGSPDDAVAALIAAAKSGDPKSELRVLGAEAQPLIDSGDPVQDAASRNDFVRRYNEQHEIAAEGPDRSLLVIGQEGWSFPFPLVRANGQWHFDTSDGVDEIVNRRIGRNELSTIQACLAYVDAETEYYASNPEQDSVLHYARRLLSSPGKKDGLYWEAGAGEPPSPLGATFAQARSEGYGDLKSEPFHGYYYKILEAQGPNAIDGAYSYVIGGRMSGGFALVAYPADRGNSGVMTFIVNQDGIVYSKDLGEDTAKVAEQMTTFDPDPSWKRENAG